MHGLSQRERDEERARMLRSKANSGRELTRWERNQLRRIEESERLRRRIERQQRNASKNICGKIALLLSPFKAVFGLLFLAISLLITVSVIVTRLVVYAISLATFYPPAFYLNFLAVVKIFDM